MLNCIVICRCLDKKPGGNTLKEVSLTKLLTKGLTADSIKGGTIMRSVMLSNRPAITLIGSKNAGSIEDSGFGSSVTSILSEASASKRANISAIIDEPSETGKPLPLCRVTGTE